MFLWFPKQQRPVLLLLFSIVCLRSLLAETTTTPLPDAPLPQAQTAPGAPQESTGVDAKIESLAKRKIGPRFDPIALDHSQAGVRLSAKEKILLSLDEQTTVYAFTTELLAAGWEHLIDGDPRFGSDKAGFGERLGAAVIRQSSQSIFSDGIAAAAFREDPRFYRMSSGPLKQRILYAASRTWRTRTDDGNPTTNYSRLIGYAAAAALTMAYYPAVSGTWGKTGKGYAISLGTNMMGNQYHEFWPDIRRVVFHRHPAD
jgi:hypothetical protein